MEKVRYAMIGFGGIAENRVAKEGFGCDKNRFNGLKNAVLVGATDLNPARQGAAEALGLKWYKSIDEILADKTIQAVYVATNNRTHAPIATQVLNAGKHVIVEKPMSINSESADALNALAKAKGLSLTVDHMMVNNVLNIKAKELFSTGVLGKVNDSCFHMEFAFGYDPAEAKTWRCNDIGEMGGPVGDVASHCMYVAEFVFGEKIAKVAAVYYPKLMNIAAEDGAYVNVIFQSGMAGTVKVGFNERRGGLGGTLSNLGFEIYGDKAVLRSYGTLFQLSGHADEPVPIRLELDKFTGTTESFKPENVQNIYQTLITGHAQSVLDGKPLTGDDALHNIRLCEAIHRSAQTNGKLIGVL